LRTKPIIQSLAAAKCALVAGVPVIHTVQGDEVCASRPQVANHWQQRRLAEFMSSRRRRWLWRENQTPSSTLARDALYP